MRNPLIISDLALAAALSTVGVPFFRHDDDSDPFVKVKNKNGYSYSFFFEPSEEASALVAEWRDDSNADSNFGYIKAAFKNRESLLDVVNQSVTFTVLEKDGRNAIISSNLSAERKAQVLSRL